jgi:hypothetical protein
MTAWSARHCTLSLLPPLGLSSCPLCHGFLCACSVYSSLQTQCKSQTLHCFPKSTHVAIFWLGVLWWHPGFIFCHFPCILTLVSCVSEKAEENIGHLLPIIALFWLLTAFVDSLNIAVTALSSSLHTWDWVVIHLELFSSSERGLACDLNIASNNWLFSTALLRM